MDSVSALPEFRPPTQAPIKKKAGESIDGCVRDT